MRKRILYVKTIYFFLEHEGSGSKQD